MPRMKAISGGCAGARPSIRRACEDCPAVSNAATDMSMPKKHDIVDMSILVGCVGYGRFVFVVNGVYAAVHQVGVISTVWLIRTLRP